MDSNNWRQPSQTEQPPMDGAGGDWRAQLQADSRQRIVNKIMDTLKHHLPLSGHEGVQELKKIAMRFEEKIYHAANSQYDYLRRISLKMLPLESKSNAPGPIPNAIPSNSPSMSRNSQDPAKLKENKAGEKRKEKGELAHISVTYHISAHGGGSAGGGRGGSSGSGSEGDSGSDTRKPAGASNENHHRRGASTRVRRSVFFIWVVAILVTQFSMQVL